MILFKGAVLKGEAMAHRMNLKELIAFEEMLIEEDLKNGDSIEKSLGLLTGDSKALSASPYLFLISGKMSWTQQ